MKVGILTFQQAINFGAQLQCYALQEVIKDLGHEPEVIQFFPNKISPFYRGIKVKENGLLVALNLAFIKFKYAPKMRENFRKFKTKNLKLSEPCDPTTISRAVEKYDAIIVGSDQVWRHEFHRSGFYFLDWKPSFVGKRISYAPCCASNKYESENKHKLVAALKEFDAISVRNLETKNFVFDLTGINAPLVLDPTFHLDFTKFKNVLQPPYKKYILTYILGEEICGGHENLINKIKEVRGNLPVVSIILTENKPKKFKWADKTYWTLNPGEWLSLIAQSDFFYTDSFHGAIFAVKYNINFLAYYTEEIRASRFIDLATRFKLESSIVTSVENAISKNSIIKGNPNYSETNNIIKRDLYLSRLYLEKSLSIEKV